MNAQTPTRTDLSDSRQETDPKTQFSREESLSNQKKSVTRRVESNYFSPKVQRDPSSQFAYSPSEIKQQQFTLTSPNRLESNPSEIERKSERRSEKPQSQRSKPNTKHKEHKQKGSSRHKEQNQELINIKVSPSKGKGGKKNMKSAVEYETDRSLHAEIWRESGAHKEILSTQSVFDSDVADEIDYEFDPEYICRLNQRYLSPQINKKHPKDHSLRGSHYSGSPSRSKRGGKQQIDYSLNIDGNQDTGAILQQACKQICQVSCGKKKAKNVVRRMEYDVEKRENRDRTIETLRENIDMSRGHAARADNAQAFQVSQLSPLSQSKFSNKSHHDSPSKFDINSENLGLTVSSKKKLGKKKCDEIYERQKQFQDRKEQAVKMMQEARQKQEEMELAMKSVGRGKISDNQKQACCDRLANDAERRKEKLRKKKEQELMKLEQECKEYFKPKINQKYHIRREHVMSAENLLAGKSEYKTKVERFQAEAQQRGQNKGVIHTIQDINKSGQSQQNGPDQALQQVA